MLTELTYYSDVSPLSSYGVVSRLAVLELERRGITVYLPYGNDDVAYRREVEQHAPDMLPILERPIRETEWGVCHSPTNYGAGMVTARRRIIHTMAESTALPPSWAALLNSADGVVVPGPGILAYFQASGVTAPLFTAVDAIDVDAFTFHERPRRDTMIWLCYGDLTYRKQPVETIIAWRKAFPHQKDVRLVVKSRKHWGQPHFPGTLQCSDSRVTIIDAHYSLAELVNLCHEANAGIFLSRFEGFGDCAPQLAATGATSLVAAHSGSLAYVNCGQFYPVGLKAGKPTVSGPAPASGDWLNPDLDQVVYTLREMYEHQDTVRERGRLAAAWVREHLTAQNHVDQLLAAIAALS